MENNPKVLEALSKELKRSALTSIFYAGSGHPGSVLSVMDVLTVLFFGGFLKYDPQKPEWEDRDYFILSNGHACPALYAVLAKAGFFSEEELNHLREFGYGAQGHPKKGSLLGIETTAGSLGQGLSVGIGLAIALKHEGKDNRVYVMMSDGEQEEGSTWEAIMSAPKFKLNNLVAIIDENQYQIDGATKEIMPTLNPIAQKYQAFGWNIIEMNGHNFEEIIGALENLKTIEGPVAIISHTIRGKGVSFMEGSLHWHGSGIKEDEYKKLMEELS